MYLAFASASELLGMNRAVLIVQGRQFAQSFHSRWDELQSEIHVLGRVLLTQAESDAGAGTVRTQSHRGQHVRRLNRA